MALTDKLRAAVYARDKAICSFSGLSLWLLDYGTVPFAQFESPDHIKPVSRGGSHALENLACASGFYNSKKSNNGRDCLYLFRNGRPTEDFFWNHGILSIEQAIILKRHKEICSNDWHFNRAIFHLKVAMHDAWEQFKPVRDAAYWQRAAWKRLEIWRRITPSPQRDFVRRRLVLFPDAPDVRLMLSLSTAAIDDLPSTYKKLEQYYFINADILSAFTNAKSAAARDKILERAESRRATQPLIHSLRANARLMRALN